VPLQQWRESGMAIQVVDSKTNKPIKAAKCELTGNAVQHFDKFFGFDRFHKAGLSNVKGIATFEKIPLFTGDIKVSHPMYEPKEIEYERNQAEDYTMITIQLRPLDL